MQSKIEMKGDTCEICESELAQLSLSAEEIGALRHQGFVCSENRNDRIDYKLRFRQAGWQKVRYLGTSAALAQQVQAELDRLQEATQLDRKLARLDRAAKRALREAKTKLEPAVKEAGFAFHGLAIRRPRMKHKVDDQG